MKSSANNFPTEVGVILFRSILLIITTGWCFHVHAQQVTLESSTMHDQNIFDIYANTPDQITQFQIDASKDWDLDATTLSLSYNGSALLFNDLPSRNYHVHVLSLNSAFQFYNDEADEPQEHDQDSSDVDKDSSDVNQDSSVTPIKQIQSTPVVPPVHVDSLDRFLYVAILGAGQFDKQDFQLYDNSKVEGILTYRYPLGTLMSLRPSYGLSYHYYPSLPGLINVENIFSGAVTSTGPERMWVDFYAHYGIKSYTTSTTYTYTVGPPVLAGHGKPGAGGGGKRKKTYVLNTPSVRQFLVSLNIERQLLPDTRLAGQYLYFATPSSEARILPQQISNAIEQQGSIGEFTSENEIFDDHYAYSGNAFILQVQQALPFSFTLTVKGVYQKKTYTLPAMDLADSVVIASNRLDERFENEISLTTSIQLSEGKILKPKAIFHYIRNKSNAPYYDFDKNSFLVGVDFSF